MKGNDIEYACPVTKWNVETTNPNDPYYVQGYQTGLKNRTTGKDIHVYDAWNYNIGRSDVKIAVVDAGVDYNHPDLDPGNRSRIVAGYDAADGDNDPMDDVPSQYKAASHGTSVAGVIGAITNNGTGIAGIMQNVKIIPVKVFATNGPWWDPFSWTAGSAIDPWIADGINYAASNGAKVINLSLGGGGESGWEFFFLGNPVGEAVYNAYHQGVMLVAAAGNDNSNSAFYPADFPGVMSVAAVDNNDDKASFSNYGSYVSVSAPGYFYQNYSTKRNNQYGYFAGTSCSAPMVSGSAGLIISEALDRGINLTNDDVKHLLEASADKVRGMQGQNWTQYYGYGRINIGRALEKLNPPYTVTTQIVYNSGGQLVWNSHAHQFYNNAGLASGNYYGVKQYKVSGHITFTTPYTSKPYVWVRDKDCIGWNYANSNLEIPWIKITNVTITGFNYETVIYYIGYNSLGQQINKYWPGNSSSLRAKIVYTVVGIPSPLPSLSVTISGPSYLNSRQSGTWTANASGGTPPYHYQWWYEYPSSGIYVTKTEIQPLKPVHGYWFKLGSDSPTLTRSDDENFELKCDVTDAANTTVTSGVFYITVGGSVPPSIQKSMAKNTTQDYLLPSKTKLLDNYPNPFNPSTTIKYQIKEPGFVSLKVYDILGKEVATLVQGNESAGFYNVIFDASKLSSGLYIYRLRVNNFVENKKMLLTK